MTPQDMNVKIAEILGYKVRINKGRVFTDGPFDSSIELNYTTDKALCWDLAEMLGKAGWKYYYDPISKKHIWLKEHPTQIWCSIRGENESLLLATCAAFLEEFGK